MTCFPTMKDLLSYALMLLPAGLSAQGIYLTPGAQLILKGPSQLILNNAGITNNGTFTSGNSTVWLTGNDTTHAGFIGGSNASTFYRMVINRQSGNVEMLQHVLITDSIRMNGGNLFLNTYGLNLNGSSFISGETEQSRITSNICEITAIDTANNVVVKSGIDNLNRFTLGSDSVTGEPSILVSNPVAKQVVKPEELNENLSDKIQVFPVPARDYFILTVSGDRKQRSEYFLFDEAGHLLQQKKVFLLPGSNSISWDISSYPAGMYYLSLGNSKSQKIRILKQ